VEVLGVESLFVIGSFVISFGFVKALLNLYAGKGGEVYGMVKHGPDHRFWDGTDQGGKGSLTIFPSTTIYLPSAHGAGPNSLPFAAVGGIDVTEDPKPSTVGAGWSMTGTVSPVDNLHPGDMVHVEATVRLYSQAIISTTDVSTVTLQIDEMTPWLILFDEAGKPLPYMNQAGSNRLTPGGFPILDGRRPQVWNQIDWQPPVNWQFKGDHIIEGDLAINMFLDADMPPGIYRPILGLQFTGVPSGSDWRAALLSWMAGWPSFLFNSSGAALPPLEVKAPAAAASQEPGANHSQRLIWYLQMDNASLGTRGAGAREDETLFQPASFVVTQGAPYVLPPVDAFSGTPTAYQLEPYLPMISYGRGAAPGPPLIPFNLPGGELCVSVQEPDGQQHDLGCKAFAQSISGDNSTAMGELLNHGAIEVSEYYGLTTATDRFVVSFDKPGQHVIQMQGWVEDAWGNRYEGGGTYEIWVAYPLDIDPGLLPGTPLAVGDAINAAIQLQPRLPAYVNLTIQHFPYSDPSLMQTHVTEGWANRFGHFAPSDPPITLNEPGEYHLDLTAKFIDPEMGEMYMGSATWGGVVTTPDEQTALVGRGRRGIDNQKTIPNQWFVLCDVDAPPGSTPHIFNSYLNGDVIWSRYDYDLHGRDECIGDALQLHATVQDTVGAVEAAIRDRVDRALISGNFEERAQVGELPLFSSTTSGRPVSMFPEETDQIAYAYLSSQRPGVRVRETVAEDNQGSGYWRVDGMYDNQPGVGLEPIDARDGVLLLVACLDERVEHLLERRRGPQQRLVGGEARRDVDGGDVEPRTERVPVAFEGPPADRDVDDPRRLVGRVPAAIQR
jgi:hypothetical protein